MVTKMSKKYGGVNNKESIDEIQEAVVVTAPIFRKKQPKSKAGVIGGWLAYWIISFLITYLLMNATGLFEQINRTGIPMWVEYFVFPSIPFLLTLVWSVAKTKKNRKQKDAGD